LQPAYLEDGTSRLYDYHVNLRLDGNPAAGEGAGASTDLVAGRYRIERQVGRGGMATVYEVSEATTARRLALKRLHPLEDARKHRRAVQLFEREYHTLSQLAHPRVVEVFDYGVDGVGPYYTMELLDGGDLQAQAPVPWQRACALARDICSALSLLHSRRMVYRDLSPRNVRCTSDGLAKLIDFGALLVMGPCRQVVGTPAYCCPEALNLQSLDQRTDLYSLGATLYFTLVGRHAFPARDFAQLREMWRTRPLAPSNIVPDIPAALDALVLDLMHLDPAGRPGNAAEVMERLSVIEGRALDEHLLVPQSYLSTPNLVGRDTSLARARARTMRATRGRGGAIVIAGESGVGRSRFLDTVLLEGKLLGALVLQAEASDGTTDYGVVRALAGQLLDATPERALPAANARLGALAQAVPELLARQPGEAPVAPSAPQQPRSQVQQALREWLLEISKHRPLMLAIDDVHAIDEPSAAFLALLAHEVRRSAVLIAVSIETSATPTAPSALKMLAGVATEIALGNLGGEDVEQLLRSVFGDVPHVQVIAHKLQAISSGNPRDVMQLAQHLVDSGVVRYKAGAWSLPASIDAGDLPSNMSQALRARVDALGPDARELALAMSLCPERGVTIEECASLSRHGVTTRVMAALDELVQAQVVALTGETYAIARRGWIAALHADLAPEIARRLHLQLAELFERRGDEGFRVAQHLLRAGENDRGLTALVDHAEQSQKATDTNPEAYAKLLQSMPADWHACYSDAIRLCEQLGRPAREAFKLRSRVLGILSATGTLDMELLLALFEQLGRASGLHDYQALDPALEPVQRLMKALELAKARHAEATDHERVLEPIQAIGQLSRTVLQSLGVVATSLDYPLLCALPSLVPLAPLSPSMAIVSMLARGTGARVTGRIEQAREVYAEVLTRAAAPDRAGLDATHHRYTVQRVQSALGLIEASIGLESSLAWAACIEDEPMQQVNAMLIHMLHDLWRGDLRKADKVREQVDVLRIQRGETQWFEGPHLLGQITACAAAEDLTHTKQTLDEIEVVAQRYRGWHPVRLFALGEYQRLRGDHEGALREFEAALVLIEPGCHQLWPNIAGAQARALLDLGRAEQARDSALASLAAAGAVGLGYVRAFIRMPLAMALAKLGDAQGAVEHAEDAIEDVTGIGAKGLLLALAYEARARVAVYLGDKPGFSKYVALCGEQLRAGSTRLLTAKYEKLKLAARQAEIRVDPDELETLDHSELLTGSQLTSLLAGCRGFGERALQMLSILLRNTGAADGYLYTMAEQGPELVAQLGAGEPPSNMDGAVREYLDVELRDQDVETATLAGEPSGTQASEWNGPRGERFRLVLLTHQTRDGYAITGVAVAVVRPGKNFAYPGATATQLSRLLHETGEAVPAIVLR
jgi:tetratricopeptide (TPR) repeat protein